MSFNGDLEHFPLVDVIQLLHMTNKTGILYLKCPRGESQLVFHNGFFVSANHLNNSVRIGTVLVDMNAITQEQLNQALLEQKDAGNGRKPLIATLIEQGTIDKDTAFTGLETLIEMTIVEVMTWSSGTFSLDVSKEYVSDEYRYFPEKLHQEILLNAQGVLMESLRIYDEKMRDGTLSKLFFSEGDVTECATASTDSSSLDITADLLGLDALDAVTLTIPHVFSGLIDHNPDDEHRQVVSRTLPETSIDQQELLINFLSSFSIPVTPDSKAPVIAIILLTKSELLSHAVTTVCKHKSLFIFSTDEETGLDVVIEQSLGRDLHPVLIIDIPHEKDSAQALTLVRQKHSTYPHISILITTCSHTWQSISMDALCAGTRSIIPRPCRRCHEDSYIPQMISFLSGLATFLLSIMSDPAEEAGLHFISALNQLKTLTGPPEIALVMLQFAALLFERTLTFVVAKSELIAEKSIGISTAKSQGPTAPLMFRIPLANSSIFQEVIDKGHLYYGQRSDAVLTNLLYKEIGAPRSPLTLIVPLISRGKVIALTYADFGSKPVSPPQINLLEALAQHAESVLDNALYRKSIEKSA